MEGRRTLTHSRYKTPTLWTPAWIRHEIGGARFHGTDVDLDSSKFDLGDVLEQCWSSVKPSCAWVQPYGVGEF